MADVSEHKKHHQISHPQNESLQNRQDWKDSATELIRLKSAGVITQMHRTAL